jgi:hypothetical protein
MSKRHRPTCSFKPQVDRLEEVAGVSSLAVGALADAAFGFSGASALDQPVAPIAQAPDSKGGESPQGHRSPSNPISTIGASDKIALVPRVEPFALSNGDGPPSPTIPAPPSAAGVTRPLALAPSPQPIRTRVAPTISQPMALGNAVGNENTGASMSSAQPAAPSIGQPAPVGAAGSEPAPVAAPGSGNPALTGYIATGGSSGPAQYAGGNFEGGGGSGTSSGSSTNSGAGTVSSTSNFSSAGNTAGGTTSSPGTYTNQPQSGPPGGGISPGSGGTPYTGEMNIVPAKGNGGRFIGSPASYKVTTSTGAIPTNISWSISGNAYSSNTFNTTIPNLAWVHPAYVPPQPANTPTEVSFYWGEKPGTYTITATATVGLDPNVTSKITVHVMSPSIHGKVTWWPNAELLGNGFSLTYSHWIKATKTRDNGIDWTFSSAEGAFQVEQLLTNAVWSESSPTKTITGPKTPLGKQAPFPLVDNAQGVAPPWYRKPSNPSYDSPSLPLTNLDNANIALMLDYFTDYAMFTPPGGISVPLVQFTWVVNATALDLGGTWTADELGLCGLNSEIEVNRSWPQTAVDFPANQYNEMS